MTCSRLGSYQRRFGRSSPKFPFGPIEAGADQGPIRKSPMVSGKTQMSRGTLRAVSPGGARYIELAVLHIALQ